MSPLNTFLKCLILVVAHVSCENLPLRNERFDADVSYTCIKPQNISHDLQLDDEVTDRINAVCWSKDRNYLTYYLVALSAESPNQGTLVDVPFNRTQIHVNFFSGGNFEFKVFINPHDTWRIVCTFSETAVSDAKTLFDGLYYDHNRRMTYLKPYEVKEIRKGPHHNTADSPYSSRTFIYYEKGPDDSTFFFTMVPWREPLTQPVLILSKGDFEMDDESVSSKTVSLRVRDDKDPYVLYFDDEDTVVNFAHFILPYTRLGRGKPEM